MFLCKILDNKIFYDIFKENKNIFSLILDINLSKLDTNHYKLIKDIGT